MTAWKKEKIFHSGDRFFAGLASNIARAKNSVDLETYTFCDDELGRSILKRVNHAAARGVHVRLMVDGIGSSHTSIRYLLNNISTQVAVRIFHPLPWTFILALKKMPNAAVLSRIFLNVNRRNHRKTCIIDGQQAWTGSMNICASHLRSKAGVFAWRDTGAHVEGPGVRDLACAFEKSWQKCGHLLRRPDRSHERAPKKIKRRHVLVRLNDSWVHRRQSYRELLAHIDRAQKRLWITNAYFVPHASLVRALCRAAQRGVDVRLLVPKRCDVFFIPWVRSAFYGGLLKAGVRIFEYFPSMLHAKTLIVDDWVVIGSSNLNHRSLRHDLESDVVMTKPASRRGLVLQFTRDLKLAFEVQANDWLKRPWLHQRRSQALLVLKNWM